MLRGRWGSGLLAGGFVAAGLQVACGGASPEPAVVEQAEESSGRTSVAVEPTAPPPEPTQPEEKEEPSGDVSVAEPEPSSAAAPAAEVESPREVIYRITPNGLVIDIEGLRLTPSAKSTKHGNGGYGIELEVKAESTDGRKHVLLSPKLGALSMAATIFDKQGKEDGQHGDQRDGDAEQVIAPGAPHTLQRTWPSGTVSGPLWWGQKVQLQVGLWGLGAEGERGRPVRKLFVVDMNGDAKAKPVISPPQIKRK